MPELICVQLEKGKFVSDVQTCVTIVTLTGKNDHTYNKKYGNCEKISQLPYKIGENLS